ncbi:MAG: hypothetical protein SFY95_01940, partial [Planctomycetota bacterium]|nr:hypothetical protein [Planctomycetota bacterium]
QVTDWTNVNGGSWFDPANWQGGIVPHANGRSARFPSGMVITGTIDLNSSASIDTLQAETPWTFIRIAGGSFLTLNGASSLNNGSIDVNPTSLSANSGLSITGPLALTGSGSIRLNAPPSAFLTAATITGTGSLEHGANHIIFGSGQINVPVTNHGIIDAAFTGRQLRIGRNVTQSAAGLMRARLGGVLFLTGSGVTFSGGTIEAIGDGRVEINSTPTFDNVTLKGIIDIKGTLRPGAQGVVNSGVLRVNPDNLASVQGIIPVGAISPVISGTGSIVLGASNAANAVLSGPSNTAFALTLGPGQTVRGMGRLSLTIINQGTILADNPAGVLDINADLTQQGAGSIAAQNGAVITLRGNLSGGTLTTSGASRVDVSAFGSMTGVTSSATLHVLTGIALTANNTINNGLIVLNPTGASSAASLRFEAPAGLSGTGVVRMGGTPAAPARASIIGSPANAPIPLGAGQTLTGSGRFNGALSIAGTLAPGEPAAPPAPLVIGVFEGSTAPTTLLPSATVVIDAAGAAPGQFDSLRFNAGANLGGRLVFNLVPPLAPTEPCAEFAVVTSTASNLTGRFAQVQLPADPPGARWRVAYESNAVVVRLTCPADFDASCFVDSDDFAAFNDAFVLGCTGFNEDPFGVNPACQASADFDQSGFVDSDDYAVFVEAFAQGCP